ncbi:MAG TPA: HAMP domain-containing sensor histidine kinase [Ktedonobacteraceae bacterium]|jgi:two-component system OmpR family sensor kinase|nr:HAMP domain-containing sensor histidine kinase [Ktedonobacteraceae bacterium]
MSAQFDESKQASQPGIRFQLTIWYTLVSATLLMLFCIIFYTSIQQTLASSFDLTLQMRAQQIAEGVNIVHGNLVVNDIVHELPELDATAALVDGPGGDDQDVNMFARQTIDQPATFGSNSILVRVYNTHGEVKYNSPLFKNFSLPPESLNNPLKGMCWTGTVTGPEAHQMRFYSTMLIQPLSKSRSQIVGVVQVGQALDNLDETLQHVLFGLLIVMPFILTMSAFVSYWLAGRAFSPIRYLAQTARAIGAKELHQRVPVPTTRDEVRELAIIFNDMIRRLEKAFVQQHRFVSDASHELRTPVAVIRNMTEISLTHATTDEDYKQVLQEVNSEAERLGHLINDLLALARVDDGQVKLDREPVRMDLLVSDVVDSMTPLAAERGLTLRVTHLQPATIVGDAARLIQVIMGLVDNALTYTNPGGDVALSVTSSKSLVHIAVTDTGIGIAQGDIEHIFERFYRADPARSKAVGGSGLGLSIVEWVVQAHQGSVDVSSQPGKGSTFTVTLPLYIDPSA